MQTVVMLTAFLLPGVLVAYWVVSDWLKERVMRQRWVTEPLLSDAIKRPGAPKAILLAAVLVALWVGGSAREATADVDESPRRLYDRVMQEFIHKDFEAALAGLRFFMELHGSSPLAASAEYWTGECQLRLGRHREALQSFTAVLSRYPDNSKQPAAALKAGLTYARLGRQTESRLMLEHVMHQYPDTPEAEQARKLLRSLS